MTRADRLAGVVATSWGCTSSIDSQAMLSLPAAAAEQLGPIVLAGVGTRSMGCTWSSIARPCCVCRRPRPVTRPIVSPAWWPRPRAAPGRSMARPCSVCRRPRPSSSGRSSRRRGRHPGPALVDRQRATSKKNKPRAGFPWPGPRSGRALSSYQGTKGGLATSACRRDGVFQGSLRRREIQPAALRSVPSPAGMTAGLPTRGSSPSKHYFAATTSGCAKREPGRMVPGIQESRRRLRIRCLSRLRTSVFASSCC